MSTRNERNGNSHLSRREFIKSSALVAGAYLLPPRFADKSSYPELAATEAEEPGLEVINVEERRGIFQLENTLVIFLPLRDDFFVDRNRNLEEWELNDISLGYTRIVTLRAPNNSGLRIAPLNHAAGARFLPLAVLDEGTFNRFDRYQTQQGFRQEPHIGTTLGEFALSGRFYPNKHHNLLEATAQLLRFQIENGPFRQDQTYSTQEILNISRDGEYKTGLTSTRQEVRGGGVCGFVTTLAYTLRQSETRFNEHWSHWSSYWVAPLDGNIRLEDDTTIDSTHDFRWTPSSNFYISSSTSLTATGEPTSERLEGNNSVLFVHLILTRERPDLEEQTARIAEQQDSYELFNCGSGTPQILQECQRLGEYSLLEDSPARRISDSVYIEEERSGFEEEVQTSPYLRDILALKEIVHIFRGIYPDHGGNYQLPTRLGRFIRNTEWFAGLSDEKKESLLYALSLLDRDTYRWGTNEAIQCVAWPIMLSALGYEESPIDIGGWDIDFARDLIPAEVLSPDSPRRIVVGNSLVLKPESIEEYGPGDLFVVLGVPPDSTPGHVAAIVAKKEIGDETALLVSDANRWNCGEIKLFRVDRSNDYAIFGRPPRRWYIIRKLDI